MTEPPGLVQDASVMQGATGAVNASRAAVDLADRTAVVIALLCVAGVAIVGRIGRAGVLNPGTGVNTFFEQYHRHEPVFLALMAVFAIVVAVVARRVRGSGHEASAISMRVGGWGAVRVAVTSVLVFAAAAIGAWTVMHAFPLAMDEYVAAFQARIFAAGRVSVTLPEEWRQFGWALKPVFVVYDPTKNIWLSAYWPLYGMLRALFLLAGPAAETLLNPMLAALSVPLVHSCARRLWPNEPSRAWLAVGSLVLSSQFLFMSMSGFAMPAHLFINLLWLSAFLRGDRPGWLAAPVIGVIALGLHNPFPHALFVAPFLLLLVQRKRWAWTSYFAAVYIAGIAVWYAWAQAVTAASAGGTLTGLFARPGLVMLGVQEMALTIVLSWQTPLLTVALVWLASSWRSLSETEHCLAAGVMLSFGFFLFFPMTQGHGWGYRYTYATLGNLALLGTTGFERMVRALGATVTRRLALASALLTILVQWPVRAWQIEHYVRPFALAHDYVAHLDADVVIVDPTTSWYGIDLVRNDPFLATTPKILSAFYLRPQDKRLLAARFGDRVHLLRADEISRFGIPTFPSRSRRPVWPPTGSR
jgi:hypothetical protein